MLIDCRNGMNFCTGVLIIGQRRTIYACFSRQVYWAFEVAGCLVYAFVIAGVYSIPLLFQVYQFAVCGFVRRFFLFFISRSMMDSSVKSNMEIVAHEMTHAFFALLTLHKVTGIRVECEQFRRQYVVWRRRQLADCHCAVFLSVVRFLLYDCFFRLYSFAPSNLILNGILGFFIGYHLDTVGSQIHEKQTDLPKVSYKFCAMFLPAANLWAVGSMLAFNTRGWAGVSLYLDLINYLNVRNWNYVKALLANLF